MRAEKQIETVSKATCWSGSIRAQRYDQEGNRAFYRTALTRLLEGTPEFTGQGLDLGCGTGFSTEVLASRFPKVMWQGVDCSRTMLEMARRKPALQQIGLYEAQAEALPFTDQSFDVVVANFSWHWFGDEAGKEIRRVLRPRGWLLVSVPLRRLSLAPGNRALARALLSGRQSFVRQPSQGYRFEEVPHLLPGTIQVARHELLVEQERFTDGREMLDVLDSRGALAAIFGEQPPSDLQTPAPVDFEWPFAVMHAQV
jgi:SAM-dependent methyltransferase